MSTCDLDDDDHVPAAECTCTIGCGEPPEAGCCYCNHIDPYDPCPTFGFGCGFGAGAGLSRDVDPRCDEYCCTPAQWQAAVEADMK